MKRLAPIFVVLCIGKKGAVLQYIRVCIYFISVDMYVYIYNT